MATGTQVHVEGDVSGQLVIGNNNLVIQNHGGIVHVVKPSSRSPFKKRAGPIRYIPRPFPALLDRVSQSQAVQGSLQNAVSVDVFGENGIGKTTFLSHMAHLPETNQYHDGVLYLYVREHGFQDLVQLLFDSFYSSPGNVMPTAGQLRHHLQSIRAVILLDDLSLSREDTQALIAMLPVSCFVISSIERNLWGSGEAVPLGGLPEQEQFELFTREIKRPLSDAEKIDVASICRHLNGHPLKIIQAASLVTTSSKAVSDVRRQFEDGQEQLHTDRELINGLNDVQKKVLALLGASGGALIPIGIIRTLLKLPNVQNVLKGLVDMGLAWSQGNDYGIVGSLAGRIKSFWNLSSWEDALVNYLSNWVDGSLGDGAIEEASDLLVKVIQKAGEKNRWHEVIRLGHALERILILRKRWQTWLDILNWMLKAAKALGDRSAEAWVLHQLGTRALCLNYAEQARQFLVQALNIRKAIGDKAGLEVTQHNLNVLQGSSVPPKIKPSQVDGGFGRYIAYGISSAVALGFLVFLALRFLPNGSDSIPQPTQVSISPQVIPSATATFTPTETNTSTYTFTSTYTLIPSLTPSLTPSRVPPTNTWTITSIPTTVTVYVPPPDTTAPPRPSTQSPKGNSNVGCTSTIAVLKWSKPSDPSGISQYNIELFYSSDGNTYQKINLGIFSLSTEPFADVNNFVNQFCNQNRYFEWRVRAQDGAGYWSAWSNTAHFWAILPKNPDP